MQEANTRRHIQRASSSRGRCVGKEERSDTERGESRQELERREREEREAWEDKL